MNSTKTKLTQNSNQRTVLYQLLILLAVMMNMTISCSNSSKISRVNQKQIIGVQLADGQVVTAQTSQVNERSNLVINNFVEKWLYLSFNWTTDDLTVEVEKIKAKVPGNVYASTFAVTTKNDFRHQYIKQFAELIDKATGKKSSIQSAISIDYISEKPTKIQEGLWEVTIVSTWTGLDRSSGQEVFQIPFNKKLHLKSIPIAGKPTFTSPEEITQLQSIVNEINQYGLQIIEIENYDLR
jgi:hypothetical protein